MAKLKTIPIDKLQPHPDNPRLVMREDVVEGIVAQLKASGVFNEKHALNVRPLNGHYQIISGHTRHESAKRAEVKEVPCWVEEMTDEEAFMELVLSNAQGELSHLEIGKHAFECVAQQIGGGRGFYATQIGKSEGYVSQGSGAWEVLEPYKETFSQLNLLLKKTQHLYAIKSADKSIHKLLIDTMLKREWSVADTEHWVAKVNEFGAKKKGQRVDKRWARWLPLNEVVGHFLATVEFSPTTVAKLIALAESIEATIRAYEHVIDADSYLRAFYEWLEAGRADRSTWDSRALVGYQRQLLAEFELAEMDAAKRWNHSDWREFVGDLQDESVSLLLTDPPYGMNFQSDFKLDRREERNHKEIANDLPETAVVELGEMLDAFLPKLAANAHALIFCHWSNEPEMRRAIESKGLQVRGSLIWVKNNTGMGDPSTTFAPQHERIIHAVKGSPVLLQRASDVLTADRVLSFKHPTEKPVSLLSRLIEATTTEGELVADPFAGVASTLVAAKALKRTYWGCEIKEEYYNAGRERLEGASE